MVRRPSLQDLPLRRRTSRLGDLLHARKLGDARALSPEQRLLLALELSDLAQELQRACSAKH